METLQLGSIDIGGGVFAVQAWLSDGPIVLIQTLDAGGEKKNSRLDLQKAMFIDALPGNRMQDGVTRVIKSVRAYSHT